MNAGEVIGTIGVSILLVAFALNLANKLKATSLMYLFLNVVGASLAGISSYLIQFWPFVVLESVWTISSLIMFIKSFRNA